MNRIIFDVKLSMIFQKDIEEQNNLNYQLKKVVHMIELQIMDIQSTLHYIQKKNTMHQIKEAVSQIFSIFNETQAIFKHLKGLFLHTTTKKLMNCFGIIYVLLTENIQTAKKQLKQQQFNEQNKIKIRFKEEDDTKNKLIMQTALTEQVQLKSKYVKPKPFGGVYLYNQNYARHLSSDNQNKHKNLVQNSQKPPISKQEFNRSVVDELNDNSLNTPHPDQILDLFTFKFKYGRENQVLTFHDQLLSIAQFFKESQNEAFQFLSKNKDQNSNLSYNSSFSDIMTSVKMEKETRLQQFTKKISKVFKSIKRKTQNKWNEIQDKLLEVKQLQQSVKPISKHDNSTQTSYNIEEQLKYYIKKAENAEQRYKWLMDVKKKEIEDTVLFQLQIQNELSLKARQIVYLKLDLEEQKIIVSNLNKKIKLYTASHKKIKQTILEQQDQSKPQLRKIADLVESEENQISQKHHPSEDEKSIQSQIQSLRKQKRMAKKLVIEARHRKSVVGNKSLFTKRYTQQADVMQKIGETPNILQRWGLSQISEQNDNDGSETNSISSTKNNILAESKVTKTTKISIRVKDQRGNTPHNSSKSIKSVEVDKTQTVIKQKIKKNSQYLDVGYKVAHVPSKVHKSQEYRQDSIFGESQSDKEGKNSIVKNASNTENFTLNQNQMRKLEEMYQKQVNKSKNNIISRRVTELKPKQPKSKEKNRLKTEQSEPRKGINFVDNIFNKKGHSISKFANSRISKNSSSFKFENLQHRMNPIQQKQEHKQIELLTQLRILEEQNEELKKLIEPKSKKTLKICQQEINQSLICTIPKKNQAIRQLSKYKQQMNEKTHVVQSRQQSTHENKNEKNRYFNNLKQAKSSTFMFSRPITQSKLHPLSNNINTVNNFKKTNQSFYGRNGDGNSQKNNNKFKQTKQSQQTQKDNQNIPTEDCFTRTQPLQKIQKQRFFTDKLTDKQRTYTKTNTNNRRQKLQRKQKKQKEGTQKEQQQKEERKIIQIAQKCKTLKQFKLKIIKIHQQKCGKNCKHLQKYVQSFKRYLDTNKQKLQIHVQNLNHSIEGSLNQFPTLANKSR